jgi:hypothetical protein
MTMMELTVTAGAALCMTACAVGDEIEEDPFDAIELERDEIAKIELPNGELVFSTDEHGGVGMLAISRPDAGGMLAMIDPALTPLDAYLTYTDDATPIPSALVGGEPARARGREIVDQLDEPIAAGDLVPDVDLVYWYGPDMCAEGGTSEVFADEICTITNGDIDFCHNGTWHSISDDTGPSNEQWASRSYTLACSGNGRARHYYKSGLIWYKPVDITIPVNNMFSWTYTGVWPLQRVITHSRYSNIGFVRGSSHFW